MTSAKLLDPWQLISKHSITSLIEVEFVRKAYLHIFIRCNCFFFAAIIIYMSTISLLVHWTECSIARWLCPGYGRILQFKTVFRNLKAFHRNRVRQITSVLGGFVCSKNSDIFSILYSVLLFHSSHFANSPSFAISDIAAAIPISSCLPWRDFDTTSTILIVDQHYRGKLLEIFHKPVGLNY